jgi:hypothetical protein
VEGEARLVQSLVGEYVSRDETTFTNAESCQGAAFIQSGKSVQKGKKLYSPMNFVIH